MISLRHITKKFSDVVAVNDVSFNMIRGEIIGLVGANGAGKSTLVKIFQGEYSDYAGTIEIEGQAIRLDNPYAAIKNGIAVVSQELTLSPNATVLENLFLGRELTKTSIRWLDTDSMRNQGAKILQNLRADFLLDDRVKNLTRKQAQLVEIAKSLLKKNSLLILDEPTESLAAAQIEALYLHVQNIIADGTTVVLISHNLEQILEFSTQIAVLRDGNLIYFGSNQNITIDNLRHMMFGEFSTTKIFSVVPKIKQEIVFEAQEISTSRFTNLNFQIYSGEIVGIVTPYTESPSEILQAIFGISTLISGVLAIKGKTLFANSPNAAIKAGIGYLPNNRRTDGLFWNRSVLDNMIVALHNRLSQFGWMKWKTAYSFAKEYARRLTIKMASLNQSIKYLSGGNQQKVLLARWLLADSTLLLLDEPFSGVDIKSRQDLLRIFCNFQETGKSALLVSTAPDDLIQACNRFILLREGKIERTVSAGDLSIAEITAHMEGRN